MVAVAKTPFASASAAEVLAWLKAHPALRPHLKSQLHRLPTGLTPLDTLLGGGLPCGGITEIVGRGSSGRTSLSLAVLGYSTQRGEAVAWVDPQDALDPVSAKAAGIDLGRLLWIRPEGAEALKLGLNAAELVLEAGGFAGLVLDVAGSRWRAVLGKLAAWVRLTHRLERSRTVLIVLAPQTVVGSMAALRLECRRLGKSGAMLVRILKQRHGAPGAETRLALGDAVD